MRSACSLAFGMIEMRDGSGGDIFLGFVQQRNRETLDPLVNDHHHPHSTVWSTSVQGLSPFEQACKR